MDISMDSGGEEPQIAKVVKWMKNNEGNPMWMSNKNPIVDTKVHDIKLPDGFCQPVAANLIAENLFAKVNQEEKSQKLINMIIDVRKTDKAVKDKHAFDISSNGTKQQKVTTQVWEVFIQWRYRKTTWNTIKDVKDYFRLS